MKKKKIPSYNKLLWSLFIVVFGVFLFTVKTNISSLLFNQTPIQPAALTGVYDSMNTEGIFYGQPVSSNPVEGSLLADNILGTSTAGNKRIEVDLSKQRLYAYEGDKKIYDFLISSGKWGRTPTGAFHIWIKLRYTRMTGGNKTIGTYYDLPNVPYTMFFANDAIPAFQGFGIHGTYWHHNFGHPMSHGCINMKTEEVEQLYYWANPALGDKPSIKATPENPGTPVIIYGTAPSS